MTEQEMFETLGRVVARTVELEATLNRVAKTDAELKEHSATLLKENQALLAENAKLNAELDAKATDPPAES